MEFYVVGKILKKYYGAGGDVVIPDGITKIGERAFSDCDTITSVVIPSGVQVIGSHAFANCTALESAELSEGVRMLEWGAFLGCEKLSSIRLPESITSIAGGVFRRCKGLSEVKLPEKTGKIAEEMFLGCRSLASITLPDSVTEIGRKAFYGCKNLQHMTLPSELESIGENAFGYMNNLHSYSAFTEKNFQTLWDYYSELERVYLLSSLLREKKSFPVAINKMKTRKDHLMDVIISENDGECAALFLESFKKIDVDRIELWIKKSKDSPMVRSCLMAYKSTHYSAAYLEKRERIQEEKELGLRERSIADWKKIFSLRTTKDGIWIIGYKGKSACVEIPEKIGKNSVVGIDTMAFYHCKSLTSIHIPDSVLQIKNGAFADCEGLADEKGFVIIRDVLYCYCGTDSEVVIPDGVKKIGAYAFHQRRNITSIVVPEGVSELEERAFHFCTAMEYITLPESLTKIHKFSIIGSEDLTVCAVKESCAEKFARERDFFVRYV